MKKPHNNLSKSAQWKGDRARFGTMEKLKLFLLYHITYFQAVWKVLGLFGAGAHKDPSVKSTHKVLLE